MRSWLYRARHPVEIEVFSVPNLERMPYAEAMRQKFAPCKVGQSFGPSWSTHWFRIRSTVPSHWRGEVHLLWDSNCEGCVYINGVPTQGLLGTDGADRRAEFAIGRDIHGSTTIELVVEMAANGVFGVGNGGLINPPDPARQYTLQQCELGWFDREAWELLWDFTVISDMARELPENDWRGQQALYVANSIQNTVWTDDRQTIANGRKLAARFLAESNGDGDDVFTVSGIGHCHIDTAWLWPYAETRRKVARSWSTQLRLMEDYPWYKFGASQAQQYEWLKQDYPVLYDRVKAAIHKGTFLPIGGTWVEMDCNLPSGESFCRQFLFGQRFFKKEFGKYCPEFWLPDTFGYSAQLPQIIRSSGIKYFLTQKLSWNNINKFPLHTFYWEGLDGTQVLTHFPPADTYCSHVSVKDILYSVTNYKDKERSKDVMLVFGHGDGGGGPQEEMLERMKRMKNVRGLPRVEPRSPEEFFQRLEKRTEPLLKWKGELYFELHRGTYTSQAQTKKGNRLCELLLREVEFWSCASGDVSEYPVDELARLWKLVLLNQFHDVLPGSSIGAAYVDCAIHHADVLTSGKQLLQNAVSRLAESSNKRTKSQGGDSARGLKVYNSLGWTRTEILPNSNLAVTVPAFGTAFAASAEAGANPLGRKDGSSWILANEHLVARFSQNGKLMSLVHVASGREAISGEGNSFIIYDDVNLFWDAWDTEVFHLEKFHHITNVPTIEFESNSPLAVTLKLKLKISETSNLEQHIVLTKFSKRLDFKTKVNWNENRRFLKVAFPTSINSPYSQATFETQFGHLQRPTHRNTSWDWARFEVCAHKWADLSEYGFGLALLNDCKYGYAVEGNVMRLSLLRSPKAPDANCDIGTHEFTYSLMPHAGTFQEAGVIQEAYNLNIPLVVDPVERPVAPTSSSLFVVSNPAVILETVKKAEDDNGLVLRFYEAFGSTAHFSFSTSLPFSKVSVVNVLEEPDHTIPIQAQGTSFSTTLGPFRILSIKLQ